MIAHVVLLQPKPELSDTQRDEALTTIRRSAEGIPEIRRFQLGRRVKHGLPGYEQLMPHDFEYALIIEVDDIAKEASVTVVCKDGVISLTKPGLYRFDAEPAQVKVFKGSADVAVNGQTMAVAAGKMVMLGAAVAIVLVRMAYVEDVVERDSP